MSGASSIVGGAAQGAVGLDAYGMGQAQFNQIQQEQYLTYGMNNASDQVRAGTNSAIGTLQPTAQASYGALNQYFSLLGIPVPQGGFQALAGAQTNLTNLQNSYAGIMGTINNAQGALNNPQLRLTPQQQQDYQTQIQQGQQQASQLQNQITSAQQSLNQITGTMNGQTSAAQQAGIQSQLAATPGYQFALNQGLQGVQQNSANNGLLNSGSDQRGAMTYAEGLANQTYQSAVSNAASAYGATSGATTNIANLQNAQGTNLANITSNGYGDIANSFQSLTQNSNPLIMQAASITAGAGAAQAGIAQSQQAQNTALGIAGMVSQGNIAATNGSQGQVYGYTGGTQGFGFLGTGV